MSKFSAKKILGFNTLSNIDSSTFYAFKEGNKVKIGISDKDGNNIHYLNDIFEYSDFTLQTPNIDNNLNAINIGNNPINGKTRFITIGKNNNINGENNIILGIENNIPLDSNQTVLDIINNTVIGNNNTIKGNNNFVIGKNNNINLNNHNNIVIGNSGTTNFDNTIVFNGATATKENQMILSNTPMTISNVESGKNNNDAVNVAQLNDKVGFTILTTENLDDLEVGIYGQQQNINATTERNYPINQAGSLLVMPSAYGLKQIYFPYNSDMEYKRNKSSNGTYSPWDYSGTFDKLISNDLRFNNGMLMSSESGGNVDGIWHDDTYNIWNFQSDISRKSNGNGVLMSGAYVTNHKSGSYYTVSGHNIHAMLNFGDTNKLYYLETPFEGDQPSMINLIFEGFNYKTRQSERFEIFNYNYVGYRTNMSSATIYKSDLVNRDIFVGFKSNKKFVVYFGRGCDKYYQMLNVSFQVRHADSWLRDNMEKLCQRSAWKSGITSNSSNPSVGSNISYNGDTHLKIGLVNVVKSLNNQWETL